MREQQWSFLALGTPKPLIRPQTPKIAHDHIPRRVLSLSTASSHFKSSRNPVHVSPSLLPHGTHKQSAARNWDVVSIRSDGWGGEFKNRNEAGTHIKRQKIDSRGEENAAENQLRSFQNKVAVGKIRVWKNKFSIPRHRLELFCLHYTSQIHALSDQ